MLTYFYSCCADRELQAKLVHLWKLCSCLNMFGVFDEDANHSKLRQRVLMQL